ncbi:MAG TPA: hypothetical protein VLK28_12410 [Methylomirabilota bacterium]|nr:hypothetical protein [Methylomirabilota bacterium]
MPRAPRRWATAALLGLSLAAPALGAPRDTDRRLHPRHVSPLPSHVRRVAPAVVGLHVEVPASGRRRPPSAPSGGAAGSSSTPTVDTC